MSSKLTVLVTGGTGFLGSHVVQQLLHQKKYIVRVPARQTAKLLNIFPHAGPNLEVVHVPDLTADHSEVLKGVWALIHCAAAISQNKEAREIFDASYKGSVSVVEAAIKAGVKKIVFTGTFLSLVDPDWKAAFGTEVLSEKSWGSIASVEDLDFEKANLSQIYSAAKTLAEKRIWQLARENPDVDVTVVIPPGIFGPDVDNYPSPSTKESLGSPKYFYQMITGTYPPRPAASLIDVRDCAKAHLLSLETPPLKGRDKRFLTEHPLILSWKEIADIIRSHRPELADRLPAANAPIPPTFSAPHNSSFTEEVLGMKGDDYMLIEKTILDTVDGLLQWERTVKTSN